MKRGHGDGGIDARGEGVFRLRYWVDGKRYSQTFHGTRSEARKKLRELRHSGDTGAHVEPDRIAVAQWARAMARYGSAKPEPKESRSSNRQTLFAAFAPCRVGTRH